MADLLHFPPRVTRSLQALHEIFDCKHDARIIRSFKNARAQGKTQREKGCGVSQSPHDSVKRGLIFYGFPFASRFIPFRRFRAVTRSLRREMLPRILSLSLLQNLSLFNCCSNKFFSCHDQICIKANT